MFPPTPSFDATLSRVIPTTLLIRTNDGFPNDGLINTILTLPKLRQFTLEQPHHKVCSFIQRQKYSVLTRYGI